jgi:hypothetical protein
LVSPDWQYETGAPITAAAHWRGLIAVGCADGRVHLLRGNGRRVHDWPTAGPVTQISFIPEGYLHDSALLIGSADATRALYALTGYEVRAGSEYFPLNRHDAHGRNRWPHGREPGCAVAADLDGDGVEEIVGSEGLDVCARRRESNVVLWKDHLGGEVIGLAVLAAMVGSATPSQQTVFAASDLGQVAAYAGDGTPLWKREAGTRLTSLAVTEPLRVGTEAPPLLLLGTLAEGVQIRRTADGELLTTAPLAGPIHSCHPGRGAMGASPFVAVSEAGVVVGFRGN